MIELTTVKHLVKRAIDYLNSKYSTCSIIDKTGFGYTFIPPPQIQFLYRYIYSIKPTPSDRHELTDRYISLCALACASLHDRWPMLQFVPFPPKIEKIEQQFPSKTILN